MGLKVCEKCGEKVDEAKAFCPECGNSFVVEEKREGSSEFDNYAGTVSFSKSLYKLMLSDIKPEISSPTNIENKRKQPTATNNGQISTPDFVNIPETPVKQLEQSSKSGIKKWIVFSILGGFLLLILVIAVSLFLYLNICCQK